MIFSRAASERCSET